MMKPNLLLLLTLLISHQAFGAEEKVYGGVSIKEDSTLKKLLVLPEVAAQYKKCQDKLSGADKLSKIPDCLWNGDGGDIGPLSVKQKEEVKKLYAQEESAGATKPAVNPKASEIDVTAGVLAKSTNLTKRSLNVGIDYNSDPGVKALTAFFGKKLDEALNGSEQDIKDKKIVTVDHTKFIDLYTSELGKSIVNAFTSYCMETSPDCRVSKGKNDEGKELFSSAPCLISDDPEQRKTDRDNNIKKLNEANFTEAEGAAWTHCIGGVSSVCYENKDASADSAYSKQRACLVMDFVKAGRKNLIVADLQKKFYNGLKGGGNGIASIASNMKVVDNEKNLSADKLSEITSADIGKEFKTANDKMKQEADECVGAVNDEKCSKFLDVNTTKNTDAVTEFGLRQFAKEADLSEKLDDKTNVGSYLKEEGYSDEEIKNLTSAENIEEVKKKIKDRFAAEKDAIIKEMAEKISSKTTVADGGVAKEDSSTLGKIKNELSTRSKDLQNLIHFNNIVASYLNISEGDGKSKKVTRNTASLFAEVNSMEPKESKEMIERIKKNKDLQENQTTADFQIGDINKILKYKEDKKDKKETEQP